MDISIIGTGRVGSLLLQYLIHEQSTSCISIVNRNKKHSEGIIMDTASAYPKYASKLKNISLEEVNTDVLVVTAGAVMTKDKGPLDVIQENKSIMDKIFSKVNLNPETIVIIIATQVDIITEYVQRITDHPSDKLLGFGGTLDVNRLKHLLSQETGKPAQDIEAYFVGEHGQRGISVFDENVDYEKIDTATKNYFSTVLSKLGHSTAFGPARALADLVMSIVEDSGYIHCVSCHDSQYGIYLT